MSGKPYKAISVKVLNEVILFLAFITCIILSACSGNMNRFIKTDKEVQISPDYSDITIPPNIAPINFIINESAKKFVVKISEGGGETITIKSSTGKIKIPLLKWKKILKECKGKDLFFEVFIKNDANWVKFPSIINHVAEDPIDSYVVYRLIDPGFELWNKMGIFQRNLENFQEHPVMINSVSDDNCMNCHSFCRNDSHTMMFHMRAKNNGTIIYREGKLSKVNTKTDQTISPGVYPAWHPGGRYIALSVNNIVQAFHSIRQIKVEVTDTLSDIIVLDTENNIVFNSPAISCKDRFETFPTWSPDGKYLYFCSARALPFYQFMNIRYDLLRIPFEETTCKFGSVDTVVSASSEGHSISFPRISPDGKYLMFCMSDFGNFSIWHSESDLFLKDLESGKIIRPEINSPQSESYHIWSSDGRWIVFSSRRTDGLFTRLYFSYFDANGNAHKPFLLPQKDPEFYSTFLKSYNVPELVTTAIELNPRKLLKIVYSEPVNATFKDISR
jgi:hypothetical protein